MLKVKLKHHSSETKKVYTTLLNCKTPVIRTVNSWDTITTCLVKDENELYYILSLLNQQTIMGVSLISARPTLATIWETVFKGGATGA